MKRFWLEELRKERHLTQADMGKLLGTSRQSYTHIESGARNPSLVIALKLSSILSFDPILFLEKGFAKCEHQEI